MLTQIQSDIDREIESVYRSHYAQLYHFAYSIMDDAEQSRDVVGEVFASLWRDRDRLNVDNLVGLLFVSVRNQALSVLRRDQRNQERLAFLQEAMAEEDESYYLDMEERLQELNEQLRQLPEKTRYVLEECYLGNKKYREVAEDLGITTNGIKKHIVKAFAQLREHFLVKK